MKHISPILASIALLASLGAVAQTAPRMPIPVPGINVQQLYMAHQKKANDMTKKSDRIYIPTTPGVRVMSQAETARAEGDCKEDSDNKDGDDLRQWQKGILQCDIQRIRTLQDS